MRLNFSAFQIFEKLSVHDQTSSREQVENMRHVHNLATTSDALIRVFQIRSPIEELRTPHKFRIYSVTSRRPPGPWRLSFRQLQPKRNASVSRTGGYTASVLDGHRRQSPTSDHSLRDEEIKAFRIHMVQPEDSRLSEPIATYDALNSRQRDEKGRFTQFLQQVAPAQPEKDRLYPICKMIDKKAAREAELEKKKSGKEKKVQTKQLELSWSVSENELSYRLERLKEFLSKGWKVIILFGVKRKGWMGKRVATKAEVDNVLSRIKGAVGEIEGAKEAKPMEGKPGQEVTLTYEGKIPR